MEKLNSFIGEQDAFTLIEILLYSFFFALIITLFLSTGFMIIESSLSLNKKITEEQEGNFLIAKIDWALNSASQTEVGLNYLIVNRYGGLPDVIFSFSANNLEMEIVGESSKVLLNSQHVKLYDWYINKELINSQEVVSLGFVINNEKFFTSNRLRTW
jgi:hypothetical protein